MSTFQVNVFVFGESIDHLERQVKVTLNDIDFGEFVSIIGTSASRAPDIRGELEAEVAKCQEDVDHKQEQLDDDQKDDDHYTGWLNLSLENAKRKLEYAQHSLDRYNPTPEQIEGDQKIREEHAVLRRKRLVLEWCTQHGSNYISPDLVSQIIVSFESADQESPPGFLRLID